MAPSPAGAIVLAAFDPDEALFRRQLASLRAQTHADWECIVSVDGNPEPISELVRRFTDDDARFRVIGDGSRLGFYLNFERGIRAVSPNARWIALCDQDDHWYPEKIERLLPYLDDASLVSGQARLVTYPAGDAIGETARRDDGDAMTVLSNQFTGSLCMFSTELLHTALPFPRASTMAAAHDHWLAVVASAFRGTHIVDEVVQDYVQHDENVFGDPSRLSGGGGLRASLRNARAMARRYEGSASPRALLRVTFWVYVGWRQLMVDTLVARRSAHALNPVVIDAFSRARRYGRLAHLLSSAQRTGYVPSTFSTQYRASWVAGALSGGRTAVAQAMDQSA